MNTQRFTIVPGHLDPHPKGELVRYAEFAHIQAKLGETNKVLHEAQESIRELQRIMLIARNQHAIDFEDLQAENKRLKSALEEIIVESGKVDIANWPAQQQLCMSIANHALNLDINGKPKGK